MRRKRTGSAGRWGPDFLWMLGVSALVLLAFACGFLLGRRQVLREEIQALRRPSPAERKIRSILAQKTGQPNERKRAAKKVERKPAAAPKSAVKKKPEQELEQVLAQELAADRTRSPQYFVQVGSFAKAEEAGKLAEKMGVVGHPVGVYRHIDDREKVWHRVRLGPYGKRAEADRALGLIQRREKLAAYVVRD